MKTWLIKIAGMALILFGLFFGGRKYQKQKDQVKDAQRGASLAQKNTEIEKDNEILYRD